MDTKNKDTAVAAHQKTVSIDRTFVLPAEKVWKAWTEPESFKKWWGPKGYHCPEARFDVRVGGKFVACMKGQADGKEYWSRGDYKEIVPQKKIVYIDSFSDSKGNKVPASYYNMPGEWPEDSTVTITLQDVGGKTKMSLTHTGIPEEMYDDCVKGWGESLDKLGSNLK